MNISSVVRPIVWIVIALAASSVQALPVGDWVPWRSIVLQDYPAESRFGAAIAVSTDWLVVGVPGDVDTVNGMVYFDSGAVYIYSWGSNGWQLRHYVHLADVGGTPQVNTHFGAAVALSGNNLLVGCPGCGAGWHGVMLDLADPMGGLAPFPIALLGAEEEVSDPELGAGSAVALKANVIAIGSALAQPFGASGQIGVVDVGHLGISGVVWDHSFSGEQAGSHFGSALALEVIDTHGTIPTRTTYLAVGAPAYVNSGTISLAGRAYLYRDTFSTDWNHVQIFANPQSGLVDGLGKAVAITFEQPDGSFGGVGTFAVGAPGRAFNGVTSGSVQIFRAASTTGTFMPEQEVGPPQGKTLDRFGSAITVGPTTLLVGANGRDVDLATEAGSAYRFERGNFAPPTPQWYVEQTLFARSGDEHFGAAVAMASKRGAVIGAPDSGSDDTGAIYMYLCDGIFINGFDNADGVRCDRF
ncbi:MAG: hypothetical protein IPP82_10560 [Xanthomonadales bacterium]|nr:hypothetical protein [Xanthomonadales bacterium]